MKNVKMLRSKLGQQGMSLVELLVAMTVSLVILGGIYQVFIGSTTSYRDNEQFSRLQENARFAMEIMGRTLRMAGYTGCAQIQPAQVINTLNNPTNFLNDFSIGLEGFDWVGAEDGNDVVVGDYSPNYNTDSHLALSSIVEGNDILAVRAPAGDSVYLENIMGSTFATGTAMNVLTSAALDIPDTSTNQISQWDILMVADCQSASVFQVTSMTASGNANVVHANGTGTPGNSTQDLQYRYPEGSEVMRLSTVSYLIANNTAGIPSLFQTDSDSSEELVEGVERMEIRYGIDTDNDRQVDSYTVPNAGWGTTEWSQVVAVRVALLLQSEINPKAPLDTATYDLDGDGTADYDPPDENRMRRVFKATFALRNRTP